MTLTEYITQVKQEHNIEWDVEDIEDYVEEKAKEVLVGKNGAIDDETINKWILEYSPTQADLERKAKREEAKKKKEKEEEERKIQKEKEEAEKKQKELEEKIKKENEKAAGVPLF